jgi:NAD+ kinase
MKRQQEKDQMDNILVVYKKSAYELYSASPDTQTRQFALCAGPDAADMLESHHRHRRTLEHVLTTLDRQGCKYDAAHRAQLKDVAGRDLVIAVGGDGTFLDASHYADGVPLWGVNSDPQRSVGYFCTSTIDTFADELAALRASPADAPKSSLNRIELVLDGKALPELALNDVLIAHANPAATTRYWLEACDGKPGTAREKYRCSGLLACTAAGSTAWMYQEGGQVMELADRRIQYLPRGVRGMAPRFADELRITSLTREARIYIDGEHLTYDFGLGQELIIRSGAPLTAVGDLERKRGEWR